MQSIKRDLVLGFGFCALTFAGAVAWGGPFLQRVPDPQPLQVEPAQSATFTGTIVWNGDQYCLRDSSGQVYSLDNAETAQDFTGQDVKVVGQLEQQGTQIRVEQIQGAQS